MKVTGIRGGAATFFYPLWHLEVESLLVLKNNRGVEENRVRHVDYGVQINKLMYQRLIKSENITLFSPHDTPGLYNAFFEDQDEFERLYLKYEVDDRIRKKSVPAVDLFSMMMQERASTGRIYIQNVDHCNTNSPFDSKVAPIRQSNLCVSGNTTIKTDIGHRDIGPLVGQTITVWNGEEWSEVLVSQTGSDQVLFKVTLTDGRYLECTRDHKFYDAQDTEVRTYELVPGTKLIKSDTDLVSPVVESIVTMDGLHDTYCVNEPKRHRVVFNGILTGQCLEIALPTKPMDSKGNGEIALCTLAAFNLGLIKKLSDLEELADLLVRALDALLDYQNYPMEEARTSTIKRRSLGVGVINFAYYLAKNGVKYSDGSAKELTHQTFEAIQYYLLKASNVLASEQGACSGFGETTYAKGIMPIDRYKKSVDELCDTPLLMDWDTLRDDILIHGLRNSTLTALMPSETSSQISNATNGIEPPRGLMSVKQSKDGILKQVVPEINRYRWSYELLWQMPNNDGYLHLVAIMQKFVDQAISSNTNYDPAKFPDGKVPMKQLLRDLLTVYKYGIKTLYYHNTRDGSSDTQLDVVEDCAGGACKI